jgi:hypothetical protein
MAGTVVGTDGGPAGESSRSFARTDYRYAFIFNNHACRFDR